MTLERIHIASDHDLNVAAAKARGWTDIRMEDIPGAGSLHGRLFPTPIGTPPDGSRRTIIPYPATDPAAAMELLELFPDPWVYRGGDDDEEDGYTGWKVEYFSNGHMLAAVVDESLPRAITEAFVAAKGVCTGRPMAMPSGPVVNTDGGELDEGGTE